MRFIILMWTIDLRIQRNALVNKISVKTKYNYCINGNLVTIYIYWTSAWVNCYYDNPLRVYVKTDKFTQQNLANSLPPLIKSRLRVWTTLVMTYMYLYLYYIYTAVGEDGIIKPDTEKSSTLGSPSQTNRSI